MFSQLWDNGFVHLHKVLDVSVFLHSFCGMPKGVMLVRFLLFVRNLGWPPS